MSISRAFCFHESSPTWYAQTGSYNAVVYKYMSLILTQEKLNEAVMVLNKSLQVRISNCCYGSGWPLTKAQEINVQNMNVELVAQMFKNYQSNVLFHLEGSSNSARVERYLADPYAPAATDSLKDPA